MLKNEVGMHLTGVKNHVGKHRHNLPELTRLCQKFRAELAHLWPKPHPSHKEIALKAFA